MVGWGGSAEAAVHGFGEVAMEEGGEEGGE
jgi:hypothetical protein